MDKIVVIVIVFAMFLTACKSSEVKELQNQIDQIGQVTIEDKSLILDAKDKYEKLSETQKRKVDNYNILLEASNKIDQLLIKSGTYVSTNKNMIATVEEDGAEAGDYISIYDKDSEGTAEMIVAKDGRALVMIYDEILTATITWREGGFQFLATDSSDPIDFVKIIEEEE